MSPNELIQMIIKNSTTIRQAIEIINDLIADIDNDPKQYIYDLSNELEEWSLSQRLCPLCGGKIIEIDRDMENSEMLGKSVSENIIKYGCEECEYIVD